MLVPRTGQVMDAAIEEMLGYARRRADKHAEDPLTDEQWARWRLALEDEIRDGLFRWFSIQDPGEREL